MSETQRHTAATGPTPAEERMLSAYDTFFSLLNTKPQKAKQLAYEVEAVVQKYVAARPQNEDTNEHGT